MDIEEREDEQTPQNSVRERTGRLALFKLGPGSDWLVELGATLRLAWPLIIYGYLALLAVSLVQLVRGRDVAVLREQLEEARAALEAARQRP